MWHLSIFKSSSFHVSIQHWPLWSSHTSFLTPLKTCNAFAALRAFQVIHCGRNISYLFSWLILPHILGCISKVISL